MLFLNFPHFELTWNCIVLTTICQFSQSIISCKNIPGRNGRVAQNVLNVRYPPGPEFFPSFGPSWWGNWIESPKKLVSDPPFWPLLNMANLLWYGGLKMTFLLKLKSDHLNDPKLIRKHWETHGHTQIPPPGPKEHQNWALWSNFSPLNAPQVHVKPLGKVEKWTLRLLFCNAFAAKVFVLD